MPDHNSEGEQGFSAARTNELYRAALTKLADQMGELAVAGGAADPETAQMIRTFADDAQLLADSVEAIHRGLAGLSDLAAGRGPAAAESAVKIRGPDDIEAISPHGRRAERTRREAVAGLDVNFFDDIWLGAVSTPKPDPSLPEITVEVVGPLALRVQGRLITLSEDGAYAWRALASYRGSWVTGQFIRFHGFDERKRQEGKLTNPKDSFIRAVDGLVRKVSVAARISPLLRKGSRSGVYYQLSPNFTIIDRRDPAKLVAVHTGAAAEDEEGVVDTNNGGHDENAADDEQTDRKDLENLEGDEADGEDEEDEMQDDSAAASAELLESGELADTGNTIEVMLAVARAQNPVVSLDDITQAAKASLRAIAIPGPGGKRTYKRLGAEEIVREALNRAARRR